MSTENERADGEFAFCEHVTASPISPWHIRRVGPEGLKLSGGAPGDTLCGDPVNGWDLRRPVGLADVEMLGDAVCRHCRPVWFTAVSVGGSGVSQ